MSAGSAADIAVDDSLNLHLVWSQYLDNEAFTYYQVSRNRGTSWSVPVQVGKGGYGRVFPCGSVIHILSDFGLRRYSSRDRGRTWAPAEPMIPLVWGGADAFDAICLNDTLVLAYLETQVRDSVVAVKVARFVGDDELDRKTLGEMRFSGLVLYPAPAIRCSGATIHVVADVVAMRTDQVAGTNATTSVPNSILAHFRSQDRGSTWSPPDRISLPHRFDEVGVVVLNAFPDRLQVVYSQVGLQARDWSERGWGEPKQVSVWGTGWEGPGLRSRLDAANRDRIGVLAWIDQRYNWGDWNWKAFFANPSDAKNIKDSYLNNDVLVLLIGANSTTSTPPDTQWLRLTKAPAYADRIRAVFVGEDLLCVWSGYEKVGRRVDAFGSSPQVFLARIPLEARLAH